ncbi:histidine kinase [Corynebacterium imitans]|uniref:sensor histidine kinase n=2 Tax=Corynebacterium imitans TaxID=156978 RepID=UPI00254ABC18|nr:histidine kinase [Corynebacterium imitans]MDK8306008.1 histidine kinase [Corynebacterium imitans]MDK8636887.1 histidine kinase [Corynebacterium imitans]MDK8772035.1 histidine kinase [Corynebacterium imitans]
MPQMTPSPKLRTRDFILAGVLAACGLLGVVSVSVPVWTIVAGVVWLIIAPFSRWRWPLATVLIAVALLAARAMSPLLTVTDIVMATFAAYLIRRNLPPGLRDVAATVVIVGDILAISLVSPVLRSMPLDERLPYLAWSVTLLIAAGLFGELRRRTQEAAARELEQALKRQRIELEHAMSEQRAFLAREIHDVVTHSLTVMVAQADGGRYGGPEEKDEALRTVGEVGRKSLSQMREVVALLRTPESRPVEPSPSSLDLDELVRTSQLGGLDVEYTVTGTPPAQLPLATSLAVQRVVQEALTNALKHGDGTATLDVAWHSDALVITVANPFTGAPMEHAGQGLRGMRERASLIGGSVQAGPSAPQRWTATLQVPYPAPERRHK